MSKFATACAITFGLLTTQAQARSHHHHHYKHHSYHHHRHHHQYYARHSGGRPHAWCGWQMRQWLGGGPEYNLARRWAYWGHATTAHIGAVVVWPHHVGLIVGGGPGGWVIKSGNDSHAIRSRKRSIAGAIAIRDKA